jgi:co-chaperonin GroES (HSP10)
MLGKEDPRQPPTVRHLDLKEDEIIPTFDNILVEYIPPRETQTSGGIIVPETVEDKAPVATVLKVGPGHPNPNDGTYREPCVKPGDKIVRPEGAIIMGKNLYMVRDREIFCKIADSNIIKVN